MVELMSKLKTQHQQIQHHKKQEKKNKQEMKTTMMDYTCPLTLFSQRTNERPKHLKDNLLPWIHSDNSCQHQSLEKRKCHHIIHIPTGVIAVTLEVTIVKAISVMETSVTTAAVAVTYYCKLSLSCISLILRPLTSHCQKNEQERKKNKKTAHSSSFHKRKDLPLPLKKHV